MRTVGFGRSRGRVLTGGLKWQTDGLIVAVEDGKSYKWHMDGRAVERGEIQRGDKLCTLGTPVVIVHGSIEEMRSLVFADVWPTATNRPCSVCRLMLRSHSLPAPSDDARRMNRTGRHQESCRGGEGGGGVPAKKKAGD